MRSPASGASSHPIVVFGDDWGRHVSSMQHVFRQIVTRRNVVWINGIGHRIPSLSLRDLRRALEKGRAMLRGSAAAESNGLDGRAPRLVIHPRVLPWHHRSAVSALNSWSLNRSIREALRRIGSTKPPILVTGTPPSAPLVGRLGEVASVYFCMDDFSHLAGVSHRIMETFERRLLDSVDAVVATARALTRSKLPRSGVAHLLPQGVNYEHFATARPQPAELAALPRPLIGFAGGVSDCCDPELLGRLADAYPDGSIVLVGPITTEDTAALNRPNIHLLGPRPYGELPAYVQQFNVGLIPYILNDWTRAVDPLKLLEYLAAGVPVVSTAIPEVEKYRQVIRIGADADAFLREVSNALTADWAERERGRSVARQNTWADRASQLLEILDEIVERRSATRAHAVS